MLGKTARERERQRAAERGRSEGHTATESRRNVTDVTSDDDDEGDGSIREATNCEMGALQQNWIGRETGGARPVARSQVKPAASVWESRSRDTSQSAPPFGPRHISVTHSERPTKCCEVCLLRWASQHLVLTALPANSHDPPFAKKGGVYEGRKTAAVPRNFDRKPSGDERILGIHSGRHEN
ncbi:hypothetical protein MTO96_006437 [Rhipicephalus appendiculatus]